MRTTLVRHSSAVGLRPAAFVVLRSLLLVLSCGLVSSTVHAQAPAPARRPNILVILTDDQRWDALGVVQREMGKEALFPWLKTPNLDRLAAEGARFTNAFVTTSLCSPSRASLLSGRYARRHKVLNNFTEYPDDLPSYPLRLKAAGYETAYIGKWHMGEDNDAQRPGFDHWVSHRGQGNYFDNEFNIDGTRRRIDGYYTTVVTDHAVQWIARAHEGPWLLILGQKAPHGGPIQPEPRFAHAFDTFPVREPVNYRSYRASEGKPAWLEQSLGTWHGAQGPLYNYEPQFPYTPNVRGVRTDRWKLIRYPQGDGSPDRFTAELYDLERDPHELRNLIDDPAFAATRRELERRFDDVSREAGPELMPIYAGIVDVRPVH